MPHFHTTLSTSHFRVGIVFDYREWFWASKGPIFIPAIQVQKPRFIEQSLNIQLQGVSKQHFIDLSLCNNLHPCQGLQVASIDDRMFCDLQVAATPMAMMVLLMMMRTVADAHYDDHNCAMVTN